jgi:hypothetical protein
MRIVARARGLSTSDIEQIRTSLAAGRKPKVVFTDTAGQLAGQQGQIVELADPAGGDEWVVVRFGRDTLPFAPADLVIAAKGAAPARRGTRTADVAPSAAEAATPGAGDAAAPAGPDSVGRAGAAGAGGAGRADGDVVAAGARAGSGGGAEATPRRTAARAEGDVPAGRAGAGSDAAGRRASGGDAAADKAGAEGTSRRGADPAPAARVAAGTGRAGADPAAGRGASRAAAANATGRPAASRADAPGGAPGGAAGGAAGGVAAKPARKATKSKAPAALTVTLSYAGGEWTVAAQQGARAVARPTTIRPAEALQMVGSLEVPGIAEAVEEIVSTVRAEAEQEADRLRAELAEIEARLAELP